MTNKFENMDAGQIAVEIYDATKSAGDVDAAFEALKSLDAGVRKIVLDALEKIAVQDTRDMAQEFKLFGGILAMVEGMGNLTDEEKQEAAEMLAETQGTAQIFLRLAEAKGDEAHAVVKAVAKEISGLSAKDYNSEFKLLSAVSKAVDKADGTKAKPKLAPKKNNPFGRM